MSVLGRFRSAIHRTFVSPTPVDANPPRRGAFAVLNHSFSTGSCSDMSGDHQQPMETSLQALTHSPCSPSPMLNAETQSKNSKRVASTIPGVFCPIALSMLAISIFIRIGFVLAHAGVLETLLQLGLCFIILFCTLLSVCALSTNGAIESGGVYHMISRALGPEFGGAIGVLFYSAQVISNGQSVTALVEALVESFGPGSKLMMSKTMHRSSAWISRSSEFFLRHPLVEISVRHVDQQR